MTITIEDIINNLRRETIRTFALLDAWFDRYDEVQDQRPAGGGWHVGEVLEHVMLTNHHLLILIGKACDKALRKPSGSNLEQLLRGYSLADARLEAIADPAAFIWTTPPHQEPSGLRSLPEVRDTIRDQLYRCLCTLELLPKGEGILHKTTMTVNDLGKMDVYQYIYFLTQHIRRHLTQMEKIGDEALHSKETPCQH
jgi:hypothetical protein